LLRQKSSKPTDGTIRRAISTAYYALFHRLIDAFVSRVLSDASRQAILGRQFEHDCMKALCQQIQQLAERPKQPDTKDGLFPVFTLIGWPVAAELKQVATSFTELQERRHQADYNLAVTYTRRDAQAMIESAR